MTYQKCSMCDENTGRCNEDRMFNAYGEPVCESCYAEVTCNNCEGTGEVYVKRNSRGEVDYLSGNPTSETTRCDSCRGEGLK
jgi:hypothetical protein